MNVIVSFANYLVYVAINKINEIQSHFVRIKNKFTEKSALISALIQKLTAISIIL